MTTLVKRTDVSSNATAVHFSTACEWWFEFTVHLFCFTHYMETNSDSSLGQSKNKIQPHCHFDLLNYCPSFSLLWVTGEVFCGHCYCWLDFSSSGKIYLGRRTLLLNCECLFFLENHLPLSYVYSKFRYIIFIPLHHLVRGGKIP